MWLISLTNWPATRLAVSVVTLYILRMLLSNTFSVIDNQMRINRLLIDNRIFHSTSRPKFTVVVRHPTLATATCALVTAGGKHVTFPRSCRLCDTDWPAAITATDHLGDGHQLETCRPASSRRIRVSRKQRSSVIMSSCHLAAIFSQVHYTTRQYPSNECIMPRHTRL